MEALRVLLFGGSSLALWGNFLGVNLVMLTLNPVSEKLLLGIPPRISDFDRPSRFSSPDWLMESRHLYILGTLSDVSMATAAICFLCCPLWSVCFQPDVENDIWRFLLRCFRLRLLSGWGACCVSLETCVWIPEPMQSQLADCATIPVLL